MTRATILVAGVGNIFLGDDGFGSEVARRLLQRPTAAHVRIADFGIRGLDLAYALADGYELVVLIDVVKRGGEPGTVYVFEVDETAPLDDTKLDTHAMVPSRAIELAKTMGATIPRLILVGCEPASLGYPDAGEIGLSPAAAHAVDEAIAAVELLIERHAALKPSCTSSA